MTDATLAPAAMSYLAQLEAALAAVDTATRDEILAGVREELVGLDAAAVAVRIRELGDPEFIAAEARAAASASAGAPDAADAPPVQHAPFVPPVAAASGATMRESAGLSVLAALLVAVGGIVIPFAGALIGYVLVWLSKAWTRRQKLVATLAPAVVGVLAAAALLLAQTAFRSSDGAAQNPLVPAPYDLITSSIFLGALVQLAVGIWLLVIARRGAVRR